jgi:chromosomal replication initiator protein
VTKDGKDIDSALREAVAGEVGRERFDLWFGDGVALRLTGESLLVSAADQFTLDRLRVQFRPALLAVGSRVAGTTVQVSFELAPASHALQNAALADVIPLVAPDSAAPSPSRDQDQRAGGSASRRRFATLKEFVVGEGNQVAWTAAQMVVERPGTVSPLFLFGPPGTGKTHLLEGIWSAVRRGSRGRRVLYLTAEQFTSTFLEALQGSGLPSFRHKYRQVDLLLIDDIQFFVGKRATVTEFQHTVDALSRDRRQLVLAANRRPAELAKLGPELTARLSGGLVCGLEPADRATRLDILHRLAQRMDARIPADVLELLADRLPGDARRLSGALNQLEATSRAFARPIDRQLAHTALVDVFRSTERAIQLDDISRAVCDVFGLDLSNLQSPRKARTLSQPRALAMWLAREHTRAAFSEIGDYFGRRSHSTVISAHKQVGRWRERREPIRLAHGHCDIEEAIRRVESQMRAG